MLYVLLFASLIFTLVTHEAAHAYEMNKRGVGIHSMGIGYPLGPLKLTLRSRHLRFPVILGPILIGAYVRPTDEGVEKLNSLSLKDQAVCYAAGVFVNVVFGLSLMLVGTLLSGGNLWIITGALVVSIIIVLLRQYISMVIPLVGLALLVFLVILAITTPPVSGGVFVKIFDDLDLARTLTISGVIMMAVGLMNMAPLVPLDGSKVVSSILEKRGLEKVNNVYMVTTLLLFVTFNVYTLVTFFI